MVPASGCSSPRSSRIVVVLPEPDSPTSACVVLAGTVNVVDGGQRLAVDGEGLGDGADFDPGGLEGIAA